MTFPGKIALVGASGFVGSRVLERFHLGAGAEIVPVVRGVTSLPRLSRFDLPWRLADARDVDSLGQALAGCDSVVHSVVGDPRVIVAAAKALIPAAAKAGVRRVVYLSSASVHGQNPPPGTSEESPLSERQAVDYNNAKVRAERILFRDAQRHSLEFIALRPAIVFGPRDRWITTLADELERGVGWLIDGGAGICNSIYVDNLVHAIRLALAAPAEATGHAYLVGDAEAVSWADLYARTAAGLGLDPAGIHHLPTPRFPERNWLDRLDGWRASPLAQRCIAAVPGTIKRVAKGAIQGLRPAVAPNQWLLSVPPGPVPSREMTLLQMCACRLSSDKARRLLDYHPPVAFAEGLRRTLACLQWTRS